MNWKLIFLLSLFGVALGLISLAGFGFLLLFFWPVILTVSVCLIITRAAQKYFLHGLIVGALIQAWAGIIHAYYLFDVSRLGMVEVLPYRMHPQLWNLIGTIAAAMATGVVMGGIAALAVKFSIKHRPSHEASA